MGNSYAGKLLSDAAPFAVSEAFKMLRTNLFYTAMGEKCPVYGITSTFASSGKSLLIVAHGGPVAAIMARLFPNEGRTRYEWQPRGGEGYEILLDNQQPVSWKTLRPNFEKSYPILRWPP